MDFNPPWSREKRRPTNLYVFKSGEFCKVGVTKNALQRQKTFECSNPHELALYFYIWLGSQATIIEKETHRLLKEFHHKNEWFRCEPETAKNCIMEVLAEKETTFKVLTMESDPYA